MAPRTSVKKVLLAEDDIDDRWFFTDFLKHRTDIEVLSSVTNGVEVLDYLSKTSENDLPNIIILDQNMPKLNGKETLLELRTHDKYNKIAIVVYSTYTDYKLIEECTSLGATLVHAKPVSSEGYNQMINTILNHYSSTLLH